MYVNGEFLFRTGMFETCLGKPIEHTKEYYYTDGMVFEYVDTKMDIDAEEQECRDYLRTSPPVVNTDASFDDDGQTGVNIVKDVLEEIRIFRQVTKRA